MQFIVFTLLSLKARFGSLKDRERGATAVEYGLMVALIAAVIIGTVLVLGTQIEEAFCNVVTAINDGGIAGACAAP